MTGGKPLGGSRNKQPSGSVGTARMIVDASGSLASVSRHDYLPFGEELFVGGRTPANGYSNNDATRQRFTGYERDDESGLDYAHARYYANAQGRFTGVDPVGGSPSSPQSFNRYAYVGNNPLNATDPTGMVNSHGDSMYPWDEDPFGDIPWTTGEHMAYSGLGPVSVSEDEALNLAEQTGLAPQNPQSQEEFEASPEYHELLVSYTNSLINAVPGATVQWRRDGKIQYIDFPGTYERDICCIGKGGLLHRT